MRIKSLDRRHVAAISTLAIAVSALVVLPVFGTTVSAQVDCVDRAEDSQSAARLRPDATGHERNELTAEQAKYLSSWEEGT